MIKMLRALALAVVASLAFVAPATMTRADQADYEMPLTGPMSFPTFLSTWLNPALQAIITNNSGSSAPTTTGQPETYQWWLDTSATPAVLKLYDGSTWLSLVNITPASDFLSLVTGQGVQFPASQNASSNANNLDDYEETSVTPTITAEVGSPTTTSSSLRETKIGRVVIISGNITITTVGTAAGALNASGFTFSASVITGCAGFSGSIGKTVGGYINGTTVNLRNADGTTVFVAGNTVYFTCTYTV